MDLGAIICTAAPAALRSVPVAGAIARQRAGGFAEDLPAQAEKPERPLRHGVVFWLVRGDGAVLLRRRPEAGLLGGMIELPSTAVARGAVVGRRGARGRRRQRRNGGVCPARCSTALPISASNWHLLAGATADRSPASGPPPDEFKDYAPPTLTKKLVSYSLSVLAR